ncbi:MAG: GldG family protein [Bdellovibrionaceae bacterium]|nr:GldG family protein [Bdellovibrio sp.]
MSQKGKLFLTISLLSLLAFCGLYFALKVWMPFMWFVLAPVAIGLMGWLAVDHRILKEFFGMKATKQGLNMGAIIFIAVGFLVLVNFMGARHYKTYDFSGNGMNTISDQSKKIIQSLDADLQVKYFYKNGADRAEENKKAFRDLMKRYQDVSSHLQLEFVEMNEKAKLAQDFGANKGAGEAFIEYKGKKNRIENYTEQDFTNAIIKVTRTQKKNIYFLEGHNERNIDQEKDETSLFGFKQMLEKNSYNVQKISLVTKAHIPDDADALIIAAPTQSFQDFEVVEIENYLKRGGGLFISLDDKPVSGLQKLLTGLGVELESYYVFNVFDSPTGSVVSAQSPTVGVQYSPTSEITKVFGNTQMTVFRQPHALKLVNKNDAIKAEAIVRTPENAVALKELDSADYLGAPQAYTLAAEITGRWAASEKTFSAVVFADTDFMSNILLYQNLNRDLALNAVAALSKEIDLISVTPKEAQATKLSMSPPEYNQFYKFTVLGIFLPLPFLLMTMSLVLWFKRRHA